MTLFDVTVVGSCNMDLISYMEKFPKPGETIEGTSFSIGFGGKGANQCVAAAKLGATTAMVGKVGDDSFGQNYLNNFKSFNVNTNFVRVVKGGSTGVASIWVNSKGENCIVLASGTNHQIEEKDIPQADSIIKNSKVVVCQQEIPLKTTKRALEIAQKFNVKTVLNAAPAYPYLDEDLLKLPDIFCANETEAEAIVGFTLNTNEDILKASEILQEKGCKNVIITLGKSGALLSSKGNDTFIKAPTVETIDTTGAGDAFVGTMAYLMAKQPNWKLSSIVEKSCRVASLTTLKKGTQSSFSFYEELDQSIFN